MKVLISLLILFGLVGCEPAMSAGGDEPIEILFIGNSYTFLNELPQVFADLAASGGRQVEVSTSAKAGYSLGDHLQDQETTGLIKSQRWDYIILQEKSSSPIQDVQAMEMGIRQLEELAAEQGANTILFMPWGYEAGFPQAGLDDYQEMQLKISDSYLIIGRDLDIPVVPVGLAWQSAIENNPDLDLWSPDGTHPTKLGTYLAASTFYAFFFDESPAGLPVPAGINAESETLRKLQEFAAEVVLRDLERSVP
jgi:hypothetical protein